MRSNFCEGEIIVFSDESKVLILKAFVHEGKKYIYAKRVNEMETIAVGDAFFLEVISEINEIKCKYVNNAEQIYALMDELKYYPQA